ncbi:MAG: SDR family oxidoreductase [Actinobacteria bacterium]|nr:SDR family oxidoreductase [Actinomycetota bacterium]
MSLTGAVAIVTGASRGLGAAIASALEVAGAAVARTDVSGTGIELDVRDRASVERAVTAVAAELGEPTVLVNNAGVNRIGPAETLDETLWAEVVDVNLGGAFRCSQVVGARMLAAGAGAIVNVASISGVVGMPGRAAYCATKAGLLGLTRALAVEWAARGVRVNAVAPGYVRTPMIENALAQGLLSEEALLERVPLGRLASPEEVAQAVVFLASPMAGYVTGQTLFVDGGWLAYGAPGPASSIPQATYTP